MDSLSFDGKQFDKGNVADPLVLAASSFWLYLAAKARTGDGQAAELLTAFGAKIVDSDGNSYWPPLP